MEAEKITIAPYPVKPHGEDYSHLEPVVEVLIQAGNENVNSQLFYLDRDGWRCDLKYPIDFQLLKSKFIFPKSIILSKQLDKIFCQNTWVEIRGSASAHK